MEYNLLKSLYAFAISPHNELNKSIEAISNRASSMGDMLEAFVKNFLSESYELQNKSEILLKYSEAFSYTGNTNNPPDIMYRGGDAFEVKKVESLKAQLPLNSSYPKNKLYVTDSKISQECRSCEEWDEKDIFYVVGYVKNHKIKHLWFVQGDCYAAEKECYERVLNVISEGIETSSDVELSPTNELARVNKVDPLGITYMRVRGMWGIDNPTELYDYIYTPNSAELQVAILMTKDKYNHLKSNLDSCEPSEVTSQDVSIQNPNNPVQMMDAKLLKFEMS